MTTRSLVELLPPSMELSLGSTLRLPACTTNLMPFSIDYDGPAPIDSFLVLRSSSHLEGNEDQDTSSEQTQSFVSAFRGRAIQSTPLPLPLGYKAKVVAVSQIAPSPLAELSSGSTLARNDEMQEREKKRQRVPKPPARQLKFSMDSDDDDAEQDDGEDGIASPQEQVSPELEAVQCEAEIVGEGKKSKERGAKIRIASIAEVTGDELTVWGPDGPIDKGDDTFFRTVGEWYSVVAPLLHA